MLTNMDGTNFDAQMERVRFITGVRTQVELADFLGIRQSSVSDAKRRCKIPSDWLITIMRAKNINPEWILTGKGPYYLAEQLPPGQYETHDHVQERWADEAALRRLSSRALADELLRRIAVSQADQYCRIRNETVDNP